MKKLSIFLIGVIAFVMLSFAYADSEKMMFGNELKSYNVTSVPATLNFTSIPAYSSFSVAASNTGNRTANFQVWDSYGGFIGSFDVPAGLNYTPVYYFTGISGYVKVIVTRDHPTSGNVVGQVSVSN